MKYLKVKELDLSLSKIVFGGASISGEGKGYGFGKMSEKDSQALIEYSVSLGVNVFDSAPIYGFNLAELRLGKYLKKNRENVFLTSKSGVSWHENGRVNMSNDKNTTRTMLEQSLRNFDSDYIDIYMVHWPDKKVDIRHTLDVIKQAQDEGKVTYIGLCNTADSELKLATEVCDINFIQSECNLFNNNIKTLSPDLMNDVVTMGWGTLDKGILSGKLTSSTQFDSTDCRSWAPWWKKSNWKEKVLKVDHYSKESDNLPIKELALNYSFRNTDLSLCGFKTNKQLDEIINCLSLTEESYTESISRFSAL
jgi:aryl-alcohol dehydrogenase-like predicted oxidoreductase